MARIPPQYRDALRTWLQNNAHKATHESETYYVKEDYFGDGEIVVVPKRDTYLDLGELALRLGRKIWKAAPELRGKYDLDDLEEVLSEHVTVILGWAGATSLGTGPRKFTEYRDEDPDV